MCFLTVNGAKEEKRTQSFKFFHFPVFKMKIYHQRLFNLILISFFKFVRGPERVACAFYKFFQVRSGPRTSCLRIVQVFSSSLGAPNELLLRSFFGQLLSKIRMFEKKNLGRQPPQKSIQKRFEKRIGLKKKSKNFIQFVRLPPNLPQNQY